MNGTQNETRNHMKNELPFIRPTMPPARPKKNRMTIRPMPAISASYQTMVFRAQSTAKTAAMTTTVQNTAATTPMITLTSIAAATTRTSPAAALRTMGVRERDCSMSERMRESLAPRPPGSAGLTPV